MLIRCLCKKAYHIYPLCKTGINVISRSLSPLSVPIQIDTLRRAFCWCFGTSSVEQKGSMSCLAFSSLCWFESSEPPQSGNFIQCYINAWLRNLAVCSLRSTWGKFESLSSCFITLSTSYIFYPTWYFEVSCFFLFFEFSA